MSEPAIARYRDGIHAIDTGYVRPGLDASHLVLRDGRAAFVDTGTNHSVPLLLAALAALGIARETVDYVILTHVHLDHAGGAGALMRELPHATAIVHPRGLPHLVEPQKLEAGTRAVYGDHVYETLYGKLVPIAAERIRSVADEETLTLGRSRLRFLHTPGHALHHVAIHDETANAVFTGDIFGISYRVFDNPEGSPFVFPTTTPTQFDPEQMHASIERIRALRPRALYLTHYAQVTEIERMAEDLHRDVDRFVDIAKLHADEPEPEVPMRHAMHDYLAGRLLAHGSGVSPKMRETWLAMDVNLNAAGLLAWHRRLDRTRAPQ
ncbi:MAG TPA: MBL fold metallo-hydrolase [Gammaproteobacteria bacterium]|nr:MBL fold metallo-hydrolase [Gammaproteobacteria bacterium]